MIASSLKPSLGSIGVYGKLNNHKRLSVQKRNHNLVKFLFAPIFLVFSIVVAPEKPSNLASVCEKYNSAAACQVW